MSFQILSKKELFKGKFSSFWATHFLDKNGKEQIWEWLKKKDIVSVLAITKENELVFIKEYRVANEKYCYQTVGGLVDTNDEDFESTARRELLEETGYVADTFIPLRPVLNAPGSLSSTIYSFIALNAYQVNSSTGDETEDIEVIKIPMGQLYEFYNNCASDCDFNQRIIACYEIAKNLGLI